MKKYVFEGYLFYQNPIGKYMNRSPNQFTEECMKDTINVQISDETNYTEHV